MATIDDLQESLRELIDAVKGGNKDGSAPAGKSKGPKEESPQSLADAFGKAFRQGKSQGLGIEKALMEKAGGIGNLAGKGESVAGPIGAIGAPLIAIGVELAKVPEKVRAFTNELHQANRAFASFSPQMAQVFAMSDMRDMMRKYQQGEDLAGSAGGLAEARGRLEDALTPVDTGFQKIQNTLGDIAGQAVATFLEKSGWAQNLADFLEDINETLEWIAEWMGRQEAKNDQRAWAAQLLEFEKQEAKKIQERRGPVRAPAPAPKKPEVRGGGGDF